MMNVNMNVVTIQHKYINITVMRDYSGSDTFKIYEDKGREKKNRNKRKEITKMTIGRI